MQMSGHSSVCVCVSVRLYGCKFKTLEVTEGSCWGLKTSRTLLTKVTQENQLQHFHRDRANRLLSCPVLSLSCDKVDFLSGNGHNKQ